MYEVDWSSEAGNQLADIWTRATDRTAVTQASFSLDQALASDPLDTGESRPGNTRVAFVPPLGILFNVDAANRRVSVVSCWSFSSKR
jgi:hypothetical protein